MSCLEKLKMEFSDNEQLTNNCSDSFSNEQKTILQIAMMSSGAVSTVLCFSAVILVLCCKLHKFFVYRLALYQILSCLAFSVAEALQIMNINYVDNTYHGIACRFTAFLVAHTAWTKLLLTLCLVFHIYIRAVYLKNFEKWETVYIAISLSIPGIIASIPLITEYYGVAGGWCWIRDLKNHCPSEKDTAGIVQQFTLWYVPLFVSLVICLIAALIVTIKYYCWRHCTCCHKTELQPPNINENANNTAVKELLPLLLYPIIFFLFALCPLIDRLYGAISSHDNFGLMMAHAITEALWGACSAVVLCGHVTYVVCKRRRHRETPDYTPVPSTIAMSAYNTMPNESDYENATEKF